MSPNNANSLLNLARFLSSLSEFDANSSSTALLNAGILLSEAFAANLANSGSSAITDFALLTIESENWCIIFF